MAYKPKSNDRVFDMVKYSDNSLSEMHKMGAYEVVHKIDNFLKTYQKDDKITEEERDALRHYYGMRAVINKYGHEIGKIGGIVHEGFDLLFPTESKIQSDIDIHNNKVASMHIRRKFGKDISNDMTLEEIKEPLKYLKIPPPWQETAVQYK